jgi:hypothetical protein
LFLKLKILMSTIKIINLKRVFVGVGASYKHAVCETPIGLVCANDRAITAVSTNSTKELSFKIRDTWQAKTFSYVTVGFDAILNTISVWNNSGSDASLDYNLYHNSWMVNKGQFEDRISNIVLGSDLRGHGLRNSSDNIAVVAINKWEFKYRKSYPQNRKV